CRGAAKRRTIHPLPEGEGRGEAGVRASVPTILVLIPLERTGRRKIRQIGFLTDSFPRPRAKPAVKVVPLPLLDQSWPEAFVFRQRSMPPELPRPVGKRC